MRTERPRDEAVCRDMEEMEIPAERRSLRDITDG
jgi:hypothetical protein